MSLKNGKRSRRKTEDELTQQPFKAPIIKEKEIKPDDAQKSKADLEMEDLKGFENENGVEKNTSATSDDGRVTRSRSNTPQSKKSSQSDIETDNDATPKEIEKDVCVISDESNVTGNVVNDDSEVIVIEDITEEIKKNDVSVEVVTTSDKATESNGVNGGKESDQEIDMEPLVVDCEEADPELQFDENSDSDSRKGSPVLSRCRTRRSQTRNIPTPKTPRSTTDQNGEDSDKISTATPDILEKQPDLIETNEESFESALSTKVNVGSDFTREIDLTLPDDKESFLNTAKELSVGETLRRITSRRTIRSVGDYRKTLLKSNVEKMDVKLSRASVEKVTGQKRKSRRSDTPDGPKRFKPEQPDSSSGFFAYISSPINKIRSKFSSGEVSASTPKLTGYRKQDILQEAELSRIDIDTEEPPIEKKWCSVM